MSKKVKTVTQIIFSFVFTIGMYSVLFSGSVMADTFLSQSYSASGPLPLDSLVSLKDDGSGLVSAASSSNVDNLLGVVVNADNSSLSLSGPGSNQVQIATSGSLPVLVSDLNGKVEKGDYITASPIAGVGMKATTNVRTIGIAQGPMSSSAKQDYKGTDGKSQSLNLGEVTVLVTVASFFKQPDKTIIPTAVQNVANAFAGRQVSSLPILISAGIFVVTLIVVVSIIYSMIRGSIISVGRNPLSQAAVWRNLTQMSALVLAIIGAAFLAIYFVLTKF